MPGRALEYTPEEVVDAIEASGGIVTKAAQILSCSARTIYRYRDRFEEVREALQGQRKNLVLEARDRLTYLMRDPTHKDHYKALKKVLVTFDKEVDWSDKRRDEISTSDETPINFYLPENGREVEPADEEEPERQ